MGRFKKQTDDQLVDLVATFGVDLTAWEESFLRDMEAQVLRGDLTPGQREKLEQIAHDRVP